MTVDEDDGLASTRRGPRDTSRRASHHYSTGHEAHENTKITKKSWIWVQQPATSNRIVSTTTTSTGGIGWSDVATRWSARLQPSDGRSPESLRSMTTL